MLSRLKLLREYAKHDRVEGLAAHLNGWEHLWDEYGTDLETHSPHVLRSMLVDMIPTSFEDDMITRPEILTYEQIIKYCRDQADYRRVNLLALPGSRTMDPRAKASHCSRMTCQPRQVDTQNPGHTEALTTKRQHGPKN